jgi:hypothetical protein
MPGRNKHSSLLGLFLSFKENVMFWMQSLNIYRQILEKFYYIETQTTEITV